MTSKDKDEDVAAHDVARDIADVLADSSRVAGDVATLTNDLQKLHEDAGTGWWGYLWGALTVFASWLPSPQK